MSLTKIQKENSVPASLDVEKFNDATAKIKKIMEENDLAFTVQHQVIIMPRPSNDEQN